MPLKPNTFRMSLPKVIMIANAFTMSILRVPLKPNTFRVSFPEMIMIAKVFTSQKHEISEKAQKSVGGCSKNEKRCNATSQMRWRFIYRREHTFPAMYKLLRQKKHDKT